MNEGNGGGYMRERDGKTDEKEDGMTEVEERKGE